MAQVETRIEPQRHDGGRGVRCSLPRQHGEFAVLVHAHSVIAARQGKHLAEAIAFHPVLEFAGRIARVGAHFKHRHHDDLYSDRPWLGSCGHGQDHRQKKNSKTSQAMHH